MNSTNLFSLKKKTSVKLYLITILSLLLFAENAKTQPFPYRFSYLTVDEGLSHTDANDIAQDEKGFIWVATFFGLDRYDGYSIKKYYNSNEPLNNAFKNRINCIYPDKKGLIWLGTEAGLQCFDSRTETYIDYKESNNNRPTYLKLYKPAGDTLFALTANQIKLYTIKGKSITEKKLNLPKGFNCTDMVTDKQGRIFLTSNLGLWEFKSNGEFKKIGLSGTLQIELSRLYFDANNNLILAAGGKIYTTTRVKQNETGSQDAFSVTQQFSVPNAGIVKDIVKDRNGEYWLNTSSDLIRLSKNLQLIQVLNNKNSQHKLNSNTLTKILLDQSQCLWVCTFGGGVNYFDLNEKLFYTLQHNPENPNSLSGNHIRSVLADGDDLWVGTTANGLNLYNQKTQILTRYNRNNPALKFKSEEITALTLDNARNLWIGSTGGIQILKPNRKEFWQPPGYENFPNYVIDTFTKDYFGNIWFGNHSDRCGVIWKDERNNYHVKYYGIGYFIFADKNKPQLFISNTDGLKRIIVNKTGDIVKEYDYKASAAPNSLSSNYTYPVCKQNDSTYWVGTIGGGLNRLKINKKGDFDIKIYNEKYGIFNDVESMEIDNEGNIWMGGNGLQRFNPKTEKLIRYDKKDGLQGNSFKVNSSYKGADGKLYFGGINGLNYFTPSQIKPNSVEAKPILTDILINNSSPAYGEVDTSENSLHQIISYCKAIKLNYLQNNFVVFFSAMHFANPLKCKYRYKLEGFDKGWNYTDGKNPSASYNNLDYKSYKFVVEASNNDGVWSKTRAETSFIITPPWWKSTTAKTLYFLMAISVLIGIYIYQARWYRLKREMEVRAINEQQREESHKQKEELYQQQLTFFTNISHEFRTPLTLILGPLENLINQNKDTSLNYSYHLMLKNAKRLINLISELMNFRKVSDSMIKLQVQPVVVSSFCEDLASEFNNLSISKDINFTVKDYTESKNGEPAKGWFDVQILEKVLFNLLNNAFKYTDIGGKVKFEISNNLDHFKPSFATGFEIINENHKEDQYIYFRVADTGIGISEESITKIFERYYRISRNHLGSGVGLALVKSLTLLHKGNIYVNSERNKGTEIIIAIPSQKNNYAETEKATAGADLETQLEAIDNTVQIPLTNQQSEINRETSRFNKTLLLVDDNQELRTFLKQVFEPYYNILEAEDGEAGVEVATAKAPDLIISDVMMPKMDGIEFCRTLKQKFETSHIPFIILSAKDALDSKIEGMESGADFYFAKPLSTELLLLTVNNIFEQRGKLREHYAKNYLSEATELVKSDKDKEFLNKLLKIIEDNIQEPEMDVDFLCTHLFISRTKLYQKIKSISDQSVGEFIRTIRLKKAIQIMTHEDITMNEVADRIGLQSSSNFSRAFKREYGKSPLQFMQAIKGAE